MLNVAVFGNGALGLHIARLLSQKHKVRVFGSRATAGQFNETAVHSDNMKAIKAAGGITFTHAYEEPAREEVVQLSDQLWLGVIQNAINKGQKFNLAIVTVKTNQMNAKLGEDIRAVLETGAPVLVVANGIPSWFLGNEKQLDCLADYQAFIQAIGMENIIHGVPFFLNERTDAAHVRIGKADSHINIGSPVGNNDMATEVVAILKAAGLEAAVPSKIHAAILTKLITNIGPGPLSAVFDASLKDLMADPTHHEIIEAAARELGLVAEKAGYTFPLGTIERHLNFISNITHKPSLAGDINRAAQKPKAVNFSATTSNPPLTERASIISAVIAMAEHFGIGGNVPTLKKLNDLTARLEEQMYHDPNGLATFRDNVRKAVTSADTFTQTDWSTFPLASGVRAVTNSQFTVHR